MKVVLLFSILGYLCNYVEMAYLDMNSFFNVKGNLTKVSWAHAVNNKSLLKEALSSKVMMLEADVVIGNLTGTNTTNIPIMAHPPANTSDLSLQMFLNDVDTHNGQNKKDRKGIKLDFKSIEALEGSVSYIKVLYTKMDYPLWLNADILQGPVAANATPVNPTRFFNAARDFANSTLSIGWTTHFGPNMTATYTNTDVSTMINTLKIHNINQTITFPVRAGIAASSINQMKDLVSNVSRSTLTIWSSDGDPVNVTNLKGLVKQIGLNRTFIDVPKTLEDQLNLQTLGMGTSLTPLISIILSALALFLIL